MAYCEMPRMILTLIREPRGANGPLPPFKPRALNLVRLALLCDNASDGDTYTGDDVLPADVGLGLLSINS